MKLSTLQLLLAAAAAAVPVQAAFSWKNVHTGGGGGFVPGIVFHPSAQGVAYARTDIGGLYRLNPDDDSWTAVTDSLATDEKWGSWGIDAVALDPQDPNKVYAAVGMYTNDWDPNNGTIIRSSDRGTTWSSTTLPFKIGGNMPGRGMGERLAVDPSNPRIILFGARSGHGLWRSTDGGATFSRVSSFTNTGTYIPDPNDTSGYNSDKQGLAFVTFDSTSSLTVDGATSRIFVGTADNTTASVYVSTDAGTTWSPVPNQPLRFFPHKCRLQPVEKALYLTYSDGTGPYDGTLGAVYRYDIASSTWKDITPVPSSELHFGFGGLGLDLQRPGTLVVASLNSWWPDAQLFRSTDSGETWSPIWEWTSYPDMNMYYGMYTDSAPWIGKGFVERDSKRLGWMIEALEIDPTDGERWMYGTGLTLFGGRDLGRWDENERNVSIRVMADGIEEMAVLGLASAPVSGGGSELLAAVGDVSGFTYRTEAELGTAPEKPWMDPMWASSTDVDYAGNKPASVVRIGNSAGSPQVALSSDGGGTWAVHPGAGTTQFGGSVAYSADGDIILWSPSNGGVVRSQSQGTFTAVSSLPSSGVVAIASDKRNNTVFYAGAGNGTVYRSTDSGSVFVSVSSGLTGVTSVRDIVAHPVVAGEVWVSTNAGLFRSVDYAATFTKISGLTDTQHISLGLGGDAGKWNVYALGRGASGAKLYASADDGRTWVDVQGGQGFGALSACRVVGSANVPGQVYVGTNGRGVFYAKGVVEGGGGTGTTLSTSTRSSTSMTSTTTVSVPTETDSYCEPETTTESSTVGLSTSSAKTSTTSSARTTSTSSARITSSSVGSTSTTSSAIATPTALAQRWGQCGGIGWTRPTVCVAPWTCKYSNDWYSQCL
ncbi:hypothetical protein QBC47DRAFT_410356 [Echria macrotheca]|uniref:CBM1 domain-containing protein n=1 Tax=Echria macrotheca TaxID=438768 RepID=A0AAJ0BJV4_9PEZI|nr:hypothetical protein QBC47DRAFT_410356 [Echria macrotheca]